MSWIGDDRFTPAHPFGPQTLPYGVIDVGDGPHVAVRTGEHAVPLRPLADVLGPRLADLVSGPSGTAKRCKPITFTCCRRVTTCAWSAAGSGWSAGPPPSGFTCRSIISYGAAVE